jgi:Protein of unknown function (DUF4232)
MALQLTSFLLVAGIVASAMDGRIERRVVSDIETESAPAAEPCLRENLTLKEGETEAAMGGVRVTNYVFTNRSSAPCTLSGYPRAELLTRKGAVVRRAAHSEQPIESGGQTIEIDSGKDAWFNLYFNSGGAGYTGKACPTYSRIRILAPGTTHPFILRTSIRSCRKTDFQVSRVQQGTPE